MWILVEAANVSPYFCPITELLLQQMSKFVQDFWIALIKNGLDVVPNSVDSFFQSFENQL